jgi:hypothetical protein
MKKILIGLLLAVVSLIGVQSSDAIKSIVGVQAQCDTTLTGCASIPTQASILCTVGCPQLTSFSYTDSNRFWGTTGGVGNCVTSVNGGLNWGACTSQPFTTGNKEYYAGASDGSVLALGTTTGPTTCTVRRSVDNGSNWSTVFTLAQQCTAGTVEGQLLYCLGNGNCEFVGNDGGGNVQVFRSSNNGASWSAGETGTGGNCSMPGIAWNGSSGIAPSEATGCGGGNIAKAYVAASDAWTTSVTWNGTQGDCWGPIVYNGSGKVICNDGTTGYKIYTSAGALSQALTLPGSLVAIDAGGLGYGYGTNTLYVFAQGTVGDSRVWVTRDGTTFVNLGQVSAGGMRGGNTFFTNGCVYITITSPARFSKVC